MRTFVCVPDSTGRPAQKSSARSSRTFFVFGRIGSVKRNTTKAANVYLEKGRTHTEDALKRDAVAPHEAAIAGGNGRGGRRQHPNLRVPLNTQCVRMVDACRRIVFPKRSRVFWSINRYDYMRPNTL